MDFLLKVNTKRSNEVILVKNLPHGTKPIELRNIFGKFGDLEKILLPPSGITAIIHFSHPTEARSAFRGLAFSKVSSSNRPSGNFVHLNFYFQS